MTTRDRLMLMGLLALVLLGAAWFLAVAPERKQAAEFATQVGAAQQQLSAAQAQLAEAQGAQAQYATAYASVVRLGQAVPADQEIPSLVYELDQASNQKNVNFSSIMAVSSRSGSPTSPSATAKAAAEPGGFTQMPFTFVFKGSFFDLEHLLAKLDGFTVSGAKNSLRVSGRLLTIQGASLQLVQKSGALEGSPASAKSGGASHEEEGELTGTITATAYVLAAGQGLTAGATPAGPAGTAAQPVSSSGSSGSPTTPAVVRVNP